MRIASFKAQNVFGSFGCCSSIQQWWAKSELGYLLLLMMRNCKVAHFADQQGVGCTFLVDRLCLPLPAPVVVLSWQKVSLGYLLMMRNERVELVHLKVVRIKLARDCELFFYNLMS